MLFFPGLGINMVKNRVQVEKKIKAIKEVAHKRMSKQLN